MHVKKGKEAAWVIRIQTQSSPRQKSKEEKSAKLFVQYKGYDTDSGTQLLLCVPESARRPWGIPSSHSVRTVHLKNMHMNYSDEARYLNKPQQWETQANRS